MTDLNDAITALLAIDGTTAAAIVNAANGTALAKGGGGLNLDIAGAACTELLRAGMKAMRVAGVTSAVDDILIVAGNQYHIIQPIKSRPGLFVYVVLSQETGNFILARMRIGEIEDSLKD